MLAQQVVELLGADSVGCRQPLQGRHLVGRVVVDVQPRVHAAPGREPAEEVSQGLLLPGAVVRPPGAVAGPGRVRRAVGDGVVTRGVQHLHPEQVLQAGRRPGVGAPQRVALEVEEDVPGAGLGQGVQGLRGDHLAEHHLRRVGILRPGLRGELAGSDLQGCLVTQRGEVGLPHAPRARGRCRQLRHGGDAASVQQLAPRQGHAGHAQQVVGRSGPRCADLAAAAGTDPRRAPLQGLPVTTSDPVLPQQAREPRPAVPHHGHRRAQRVRLHRAGPQHQVHLGGHRHPLLGQGVRVGGHLQHRGHGRVGRQLRVAHPPALRRADHEVGQPRQRDQRLAVGAGPGQQHRRLVYHLHRRLGAPLHRPRHPLLEGLPGEAPRTLTHHHAVGVQLLQPGELPLLVGVPQLGEALGHRVLEDLTGRPAQGHVQPVQQGELALAGDPQVLRARGERPVIEEEHAPTLGASTDSPAELARRGRQGVAALSDARAGAGASGSVGSRHRCGARPSSGPWRGGWASRCRPPPPRPGTPAPT